MNIFDDIKQVLQNDNSWDIKLRIETAYFDVILTTRDDEDYNNSSDDWYCHENEPTYIPIRYSVASDEVFILMDEIMNNKALGFTTLHTIQKVMKVMYDHKNEIDQLCNYLSGMDRELLDTRNILDSVKEKVETINKKNISNVSKKCIDFDLIKKYPNKYNLTPSNIKQLKILDWDKLKKHTWYNSAMIDTGEWYCHLEGSNNGGAYTDEDEFWIGFNKDNDEINYHFTSFEGMCGYNFEKFYDINSIENQWDLNVQVNALQYLNMLIDNGILGIK